MELTEETAKKLVESQLKLLKAINKSNELKEEELKTYKKQLQLEHRKFLAENRKNQIEN